MPSSQECPPVEQLQQLAIGQLSEPSATKLEQHLLQCDECARQIVQIHQADALIAAMQEAGRGPVERSPEEQAQLEQLMSSLKKAHRHRLAPMQFAARFNCPHCQNPIEIVTDSQDEEAICPSCGSSLTLDTSRSLTWNKQRLPQIAHFELIEAVGHGAFGTVYKARDHQLQRLVAIKVPRSGALATSEDEDRFVREARNAAQLRHPGIVAIHSVGRSDTFPYLVSEFAEGVTLSQYLTAKRFSVKDGAGLIRDIALSLQHAHEQGVVHRDLKPSNIMLAPDGSPRLMDFGCAKRDAGEITMTLDGQILGTPAYMSPEQARGHAHQADARSDIYSLGVILFQLLTGELPFRGEVRMLLHQVLHDEPPSPRKLNSHTPRDLDTICLKCLAKEPKRRYASAGELAEDVQRYLDGHPILARPVSRVEQTWRWCRRNPVVAASLTVAVCSLLMGTGVSTWQAIRATSGWERAEWEARRADIQTTEARKQERIAIEKAEEAARQSARADDEATRAKVSGELTSFMRELFTSSDATGLTGSGLMPAGEGSRSVTAVELLKQGIKLIQDRLQNSSRSEQLTRAAMVSAIGDVSRSLGLLDESKPLLVEALRIRQDLLPADDPEIAASQFQLANWHAEKGDFFEAEKLYAEVLAFHRRRGTIETLEAGDAQLRMAALYVSIGDKRGEQYARDCLATRERILDKGHRDTAIARMILAGSLFDQEKTVEAVMTVGTAMDFLFSTNSFEKEEFLVAVREYQAGVALQRIGFLSHAIEKFRNTVELLKKTVGRNHLYIAIPLYELGLALRENGELQEADKVWRECVEVVRATVGLEHPRALNLIRSYGELLFELGHPEQGWHLVDEALQASEQRYGKTVPWRQRLLITGVVAAARANQVEAATRLGEEAIASLEKDSTSLNRIDHFDLGAMAQALGLLQNMTLSRKAYALVFAIKERKSDLEYQWANNLYFGSVLVDNKCYKEAEPYLREAMRLTSTLEVQKSRDFPHALSGTLLWLGRVDLDAGRFTEAEARFRAALAAERKLGSKASIHQSLLRLFNFLISQQRFEEAVSLIKQCGRLKNLSPFDRALCLYLQAALSAARDTLNADTSMLEDFETAVGSSTVPGVAVYRARAVVFANGNVSRELTRLDDLLRNGVEHDGVLIARASCALRLKRPEVAIESLDRIKSRTEVDSMSQLRPLFMTFAMYLRTPTDMHQDNLQAAVERAESVLVNTKTLTNPELGGYETSNQLELRWWCNQIRKELQGDGS